jgi:6-phosphogluconolactonase (cycloisomerase 2 family)
LRIQEIYSFKINGDGTLTANGSVVGTNEEGNGVPGDFIESTGKYYYQGTNYTPITYIYSIDQSSGALTNVGSTPYGGEMMEDPSHTYLLMAGNTIASFTGVGTSSLTFKNTTAGEGYFNAQFDPTSQFIYAITGNGGAIGIGGYKFDYTDGSFAQVPNSPYATGNNPYTFTMVKMAR